MAQIINRNRSVHYYDLEGNPAYGASVIQARKNNYLPSITTVNGIIDKYNLGIWKQEQAIKATLEALQEYRFNGVNELNIGNWELVKLINIMLKENTLKAAEFGSLIHKMIENYLNKTWNGKDNEFAKNPKWEVVKKWIDKNIEGSYELEKSFGNKHLGFGGRIDFIGTVKGQKVFIDFKTQKIKKGKPHYWEEMGYQLAAYRKYNSQIEKFIPGENGYKCMTVLITTNESIHEVHTKIWPETWQEMKENKIRAGVPLEHCWSVFWAAKELFCKIKRL